jgi:hypothetical protein
MKVTQELIQKFVTTCTKDHKRGIWGMRTFRQGASTTFLIHQSPRRWARYVIRFNDERLVVEFRDEEFHVRSGGEDVVVLAHLV